MTSYLTKILSTHSDGTCPFVVSVLVCWNRDGTRFGLQALCKTRLFYPATGRVPGSGAAPSSDVLREQLVDEGLIA
jgi:hypothetical protein